MRRRILCACLLMLVALPLQAQDSAAIDLRGLAAFRAGDDDVWRSTMIDEREGWSFIPVPGAWERAGFPLLDGFGWYRIRFRISAAMRDDSLVLVMSAVDDADETYLNGRLVGATGSFPPALRTELRSLRVYPLPRELREEHNVLAIRVYDAADSGGITGSILRIIRPEALPRALDEVVDEPFHEPELVFTNGVMASGFDPATLAVTWTRPHAFHEIENGLATETVLSDLTLTLGDRDGTRALAAFPHDAADWSRDGPVLHCRLRNGVDVFWFHPSGIAERALVIIARIPEGSGVTDAGISFTARRPYWTLRDVDRRTPLYREKIFVLVYHSCCQELVDRDADALLAAYRAQAASVGQAASAPQAPLLSPEREYALEDSARAGMQYPPSTLSAAEQFVYRRSVSLLLQARVREAGAGEGQILSAFAPPSRAVTVPRDHLLACMALASAGLPDAARRGLEFLRSANPEAYTFFSVDGLDYGIGYHHLVTPAQYLGNGNEKRWTDARNAVLSKDGLPLVIETVEALRSAEKRRATLARRSFSDSAFLAPLWTDISRRAADVILYLRDSSGLVLRDGGPWGPGISAEPNLYTTLHAIAALRLASGWARTMRDGTRAYLYANAAARSRDTVLALVARARHARSAAELSGSERLVFHPLLVDGILLDIFVPGGAAAAFALEVMEGAFQIEDTPDAYNAQPDGDWFARQARPQLSLRLARAYALCGRRERAEKLFADVTALAAAQRGMIPELVDPVSKNWYGALPAIGAGAAEYIFTAELLSALRGTP